MSMLKKCNIEQKILFLIILFLLAFLLKFVDKI